MCQRIYWRSFSYSLENFSFYQDQLCFVYNLQTCSIHKIWIGSFQESYLGLIHLILTNSLSSSRIGTRLKVSIVSKIPLPLTYKKHYLHTTKVPWSKMNLIKYASSWVHNSEQTRGFRANMYLVYFLINKWVFAYNRYHTSACYMLKWKMYAVFFSALVPNSRMTRKTSR